ncbi:type II toxin-antitoxin system RelE/ParE family toxin [Methylomonas fluvii]|uniref:Type II toxin-antitoxin system RelE/ParE family toxin n=1 Tax=Methylomonas fluvii TaxID=1854564 RepID=A0ABR9DEG1_9GAMM|nr:type II toxin-antitoxin system RelE/ParE family toxin [Methylomonas fluvii]MBD9361345.1 type II toxin-antitoxin system RelE/ParE family toxin [Methylomonas fluvii]
MKIRIFDSAKFDLLDGFEFYERQQEGVGRYFLDSLYADIDSLTLYAGIHPQKFADFHRLLARSFPYAIYYTVDDEFVSVYAVMDCRQDPINIKARLENERIRRWGD